MLIYLAAFETQRSNYAVECPSDMGVFNSYFYQEKTDAALDYLRGVETGPVVIDSGAHSFFGQYEVISAQNRKGPTGGKKRDPHEYLAAYIKWVKANLHRAHYFVELDIQEIVGIDTVDRWRQDYIDEGIADRIIPVWHRMETEQRWMDLIETWPSRYLGIEGKRAGKRQLSYGRFIQPAYEAGVRVHGFALVDDVILKTYPFYSVDSSSWTQAIRWGLTPFYDAPNMRVRQNGNLTRADVAKHGIPVYMDNALRDQYTEKLQYSIVAYQRLQRDLTALWASRGIDWSPHETTPQL